MHFDVPEWSVKTPSMEKDIGHGINVQSTG